MQVQTTSEINFRLHPKQTIAFDSPATEMAYGGAAGGGKSHFGRMKCIFLCALIPGFTALIVRRKNAELISNHLDGPGGLRETLKPWIDQKRCKIVREDIGYVVRFWNGSKIYLQHWHHVKNHKDNFQGPEYHFIFMDEGTQFFVEQYNWLRSRLRYPSNLKIPDDWKRRLPAILVTCNPGGVGHQWVLDYFQPMQSNFELRQMSDDDGGMLRQFIPAFLHDNPSIGPEQNYAAKLKGLGAKLAKAMLEGDWSAIEGAFFDTFDRELHVVKAQKVPDYLTRFRTYDHGYARPFAHGWWGILDGETQLEMSSGKLVTPAKGALWLYREWYGKSGPDKGVRLEPQFVGAGVIARQMPGEKFSYSLSDRYFRNKGLGKSIAEVWAEMGLHYGLANDDRAQGWSQLRMRLAINEESGCPDIFFVDGSDTVRTLPMMMHSERDPEDLDDELEDHAADMVRMACMSRLKAKVKDKRKEEHELSINSMERYTKEVERLERLR